MNRSTWSKLAVLALASCVAVVACGDDEKNGGGTAGSAGQNEGGDGTSTAGSSTTAGKGGGAGTAGTAGTGGNAGAAGTAGEGGNPAAGAGGETLGGSGNVGGEGGAPGAGGAPEVNGSGGEGGYPGGCDIEKDYGSLGAVDGTATIPDDGIIDYTTLLDQGTLPDELHIQLFDGLGVFADGVAAPGTYELTGDELNYSTCGACVLIFENPASANDYRGVYMATGGTVTITEVSPKLVGTLKNVSFQHVTLDQDSNSIPVGDDCGTHIKSLSFDETVTVQ